MLVPTTANSFAAFQQPHAPLFYGYPAYMPGPYYGYPPIQHLANDSHIIFPYAPCPATPSRLHDTPASIPLSPLNSITIPCVTKLIL